MLDFQKKGLIFHKKKKKKCPQTDRTRLSDLLSQNCRLFGASGSHDSQVLDALNFFDGLISLEYKLYVQNLLLKYLQRCSFGRNV